MRVIYYGRLYLIMVDEFEPVSGPVGLGSSLLSPPGITVSFAPERFLVIGMLHSLFNGNARFNLVARSGGWFVNEKFEVPLESLALPGAYEEIHIEDLPTYVHWPNKTELFDQLLKGNNV